MTIHIYHEESKPMSTPNAKHTPIPWEIDRTEKYYKPCIRMNGVITAWLPDNASGVMRPFSARVKETDDANAALIVKAVNCHQVLVDALYECLDALFNETADYPDSPWIKSVKDKARAALKQAEGE
jgi:hypothetical protein